MLNTCSSSLPGVNCRCSRASSAFKTLYPFFRHAIPWIVQAILLHGSESQIYSPAQIAKIDSLHYKALRQFLYFFHIKSPYYHRVLQPSDSPCSNNFLLSALPSCIYSSMRIFDSRIKYLGHMLPIANPSLTLRTISAPFRRGAPQAHWPELSLAESSRGVQHYRNSPPILDNF